MVQQQQSERLIDSMCDCGRKVQVGTLCMNGGRRPGILGKGHGLWRGI